MRLISDIGGDGEIGVGAQLAAHETIRRCGECVFDLRSSAGRVPVIHSQIRSTPSAGVVASSGNIEGHRRQRPFRVE